MEREPKSPAIWIAMGAIIVLLGAGAWFWLGRAPSAGIPEPTPASATPLPPAEPTPSPVAAPEPPPTSETESVKDEPVRARETVVAKKTSEKKPEAAAKDAKKEAAKPVPPPPPPEPDPADKKTGKVFVTSRPSGAKVVLDGKSVGKTPLEVEIRGKGHLSLSLDGYANLEKDVRLADVHGTLNLVLQAAGGGSATGASMGKFFLSSSPAGAEIVHQGKVIGKTPKMVELPAGNRTLNLRSGALQKSIDVEVKEGQNPAQHVPL